MLLLVLMRLLLLLREWDGDSERGALFKQRDRERERDKR